MPAVISPQRTEVGPPLDNARDNDVAKAVHEFRMANAKPSIASGENVRFNSGACPRAASCSASSEVSPPVMVDMVLLLVSLRLSGSFVSSDVIPSG